MKLSPQEIKQFQKKILGWYKVHRRDLPWRQGRDPYHILISEVMLQQTQVNRVIPKYEEWLQVFPDIQTLAKASTREVLLHWSGLGYNRRALYLKEFAVRVVREFGGVIPSEEQELRELPGIGEYTARAILCFAFNKQVAVVDTNVKKVILFHMKIDGGKWKLDIEAKNMKLEKKSSLQHPSSKSRIYRPASTFKKETKHNILLNKDIQAIAEQLVPRGKAYEWNQALMDYAAVELKQYKIPIPRQSKFKDSDRYYRGQIVKYLLVHTTSLEKDMYKLFSQLPTMSRARFKKILHSMVKDNIIQKKGKSIGFLL